ncbi:MAG: hypothetical protein AB7P04_06880 [Bacteriovoracia bacterium]
MAASSAGATELYPPNFRVAYPQRDPANLTVENLKLLDDLNAFGLNALLVNITGNSVQDANTIQIIRGHATLRKFKWIANVGTPVWAICNPPIWNSNTNQMYPGYCPEHPTAADWAPLTAAVQTVLQNADLFVGYYTHDEPGQWSIPNAAQIRIYNRLRQLDPNIQARPVAITQTWAPYYAQQDRAPADRRPLTAADIEERYQHYFTPHSYDALWIDDYDYRDGHQEIYVADLNRLGMLNKPLVPVLYTSAGREQGCGWRNTIANGNDVRTALRSIGRENQIAGFSYYHIFQLGPDWAPSHPWFEYNIDACPQLFDATTQHLVYEGPRSDNRFNHARASWTNDQGTSVPIDQPWTNPLGAVEPVNNHALSGGGTVSGTRMILPGRNNSSITGDFPGLLLAADRAYYLYADVGLSAASTCGNGARLSVYAHGTGVPLTLLHQVTIPRNAGRVSFLASLRDLRGRTLTIRVVADSQGNSGCDHVILGNARVVARPLHDRVTNPNTFWWATDPTNPSGRQLWYGQNSTPAQGYVRSGNGYPLSGGGSVSTGFFVHPPYAAPSTVSGYFPFRAVPTHLRTFLFLQAGMSAYAECGEGVEINSGFWGHTRGRGGEAFSGALGRGAGKKSYFGEMSGQGVNGSPDVEVRLTVRSGANANCDHTLFEDMRYLWIAP